jgi:hypothetical protein
MTDAVILRASVRVGVMSITKAVRFDSTTTVREARAQIADKCALGATDQGCLFFTLSVVIPHIHQQF